jgi:hypothetical protein
MLLLVRRGWQASLCFRFREFGSVCHRPTGSNGESFTRTDILATSRWVWRRLTALAPISGSHHAVETSGDRWRGAARYQPCRASFLPGVMSGHRDGFRTLRPPRLGIFKGGSYRPGAGDRLRLRHLPLRHHQHRGIRCECPIHAAGTIWLGHPRRMKGRSSGRKARSGATTATALTSRIPSPKGRPGPTPRKARNPRR